MYLLLKNIINELTYLIVSTFAAMIYLKPSIRKFYFIQLEEYIRRAFPM